MNNFLLLILAFLLLTCGTKNSGEQSIREPTNIKTDKSTTEIRTINKRDSLVITEVVNGINYFDYEYRRWNGITWEKYGYTGNSDNAVALLAYQLLTSHNEPDFVDWAAFTNLFERTSVVKNITRNVFSLENDPELKGKGIDEINSSFMDYAKTQVAKDMKEYGQSDGPYFDLVKRFGNKTSAKQ